jgi:glutamyl-tRNA reductase
MSILALGINHHRAPLDLRERVAFPADTLPGAFHDLVTRTSIHEALILSTCNRTELYTLANAPDTLADWLAFYHRLDPADLRPFLYTLTGEAAARHLFRVASGLDSMVLGETQIVGQIKEATMAATRAGTLGGVLHKLVQRAFSVAKEVRSSTAIGANTVSMAAAAVQMAERIFGSLSEQKILFIGAGEMIELAATHFCARCPAAVTVANRTEIRAADLARRFGGRAIRLDAIANVLFEHDIVVSCTASPLPIIGLGLVERSLKARRHRPMLMVDLAVPRDIEPEVGSRLDDVFLYTVDDLAEIVKSGMESRQAAVLEAETIVASQTVQFMQWLASRETVPLIRHLRDTAERARRRELAHAMKLLAAGHAPEKILEHLSNRLMNKFLHAPTEVLRTADGEQMRPVLERLFRLLPPEDPPE